MEVKKPGRKPAINPQELKELSARFEDLLGILITEEQAKYGEGSKAAMLDKLKKLKK